jgi:hypothetical protein
MATAQKKIKKIATARKNSNANAHCTHLPLPAQRTSQPKGKVKRVQSPTLLKPVSTDNFFPYICNDEILHTHIQFLPVGFGSYALQR